METPKIKFVFDRKHTASKSKQGKIDLRITFDYKQKFISTGLAVLPSQWTDAPKDGNHIKGTGADMEQNAILSEMRKKALKIVSDMLENGRVDISAVPVLMKRQNVGMTFLDYVFKRMEVKKKQITDHTHKSYVTTFNKLSEFGKIKFFTDVTQGNIRAFSEWLHAYERAETDKYGRSIKKRYSQATIYKITSNLSLFISDAVVDGYLDENPYVTKRMNENKGATRIDQYLTKDEVAMIEKSEMPTKSLSEARDLFLVQCYTGMAYIDLMTYDFTRHRANTGLELCSGCRHKTGVEFAFVMTDRARAILEKYDYFLPKVPNQKYNIKLKLVADAAKIDKPLTSHMGRRTAGSVWLNDGIPVEVVSRCLGHSSIAMTQRAYAKILDKTIIEAFCKTEQ